MNGKCVSLKIKGPENSERTVAKEKLLPWHFLYTRTYSNVHALSNSKESFRITGQII